MRESMNNMEMQRRSPYQGLIPYDEADTPFFFGREKETRLIVANLFAAPLTLLYGPSGVGKSSILRAGVIPRLRQESDVIVIPFNTWQGEPISSLTRAVHVACPDVPLGTSTSFTDSLLACATQLDRQLIILLDQFEEFFTYHPLNERAAVAFDLDFSQALTRSDVPVSFLISIREDSLAKLDRFERHVPPLFENYLRLEHLDRRAATDAIVQPVKQFNHISVASGKPYEVEPALVETVIEQVQTGHIVIGQIGRGQILPKHSTLAAEDTNLQIEAPFLQLVMMRLWEEEVRQNSTTLRLGTLTSLGGSEQIIRSHLDAMMKDIKPDQQEVAAHILNYLVTPSGTKIALSAETLSAFTDIPSWRVETTVNRLTQPDLRILNPVAAGGMERRETWYEIFHDALAPAVLDWRTRYFRRRTLPDRLTRPFVYAAAVALMLQTLPQLSSDDLTLSLLRGFALVVFHAAAFSQVFQWFYRQVRPKVTLQYIAGLETRNMGLLLGPLLPILWYTSTDWPHGGLYGITSVQFIQYMVTLVPTLTIALITCYVGMQGAGQLTYRNNGHFETGFYGAYFLICVLVIFLILLNLVGVVKPWIAFY